MVQFWQENFMCFANFKIRRLFIKQQQQQQKIFLFFYLMYCPNLCKQLINARLSAATFLWG